MFILLITSVLVFCAIVKHVLHYCGSTDSQL